MKDARMPPCQDACPTHTDVPAFIELIRQGRYDEAYLLNRTSNIFPSVCGRVCTHPCQLACRRHLLSGTLPEARRPVQIRLLKRFAADRARRQERPTEENEKRIAIVGAGPAGLAAANDLALLGYRVTVYEKSATKGGMMATAIPDHRLPKEIVALEVAMIEALGVEIKTEVEIGRTKTLADLKAEAEAIFLATGMQKSRPLALEHADADGIYDALHYLRASIQQEPIRGRQVLVLGGGNVALDAARTAVRLDAEAVHVVCVEKWDPGHPDHLPVADSEYRTACQEGVRFHFSRSPQEIEISNNQIESVTFAGVTAVFCDGRFAPVIDEDVQERISSDTVIVALGQLIDDGFDPDNTLTKEGVIAVDPLTMQTSVPHLFAGGDAVSGPASIIEAIAAGRRAARSIDRYVCGPSQEEPEGGILASQPSRKGSWTSRAPAEPTLRCSGLTVEADPGLTDSMAAAETERCLQCNLTLELATGSCIYCQTCIDGCPQRCLKLERLDGDGQPGPGKFFSGEEWHTLGDSVVKHDAERCIACGLCAQRCPVRAVSFTRFSLSASTAT